MKCSRRERRRKVERIEEGESRKGEKRGGGGKRMERGEDEGGEER